MDGNNGQENQPGTTAVVDQPQQKGGWLSRFFGAGRQTPSSTPGVTEQTTAATLPGAVEATTQSIGSPAATPEPPGMGFGTEPVPEGLGYNTNAPEDISEIKGTTIDTALPVGFASTGIEPKILDTAPPATTPEVTPSVGITGLADAPSTSFVDDEAAAVAPSAGDLSIARPQDNGLDIAASVITPETSTTAAAAEPAAPISVDATTATDASGVLNLATPIETSATSTPTGGTLERVFPASTEAGAAPESQPGSEPTAAIQPAPDKLSNPESVMSPAIPPLPPSVSQPDAPPETTVTPFAVPAESAPTSPAGDPTKPAL